MSMLSEQQRLEAASCLLDLLGFLSDLLQQHIFTLSSQETVNLTIPASVHRSLVVR